MRNVKVRFKIHLLLLTGILLFGCQPYSWRPHLGDPDNVLPTRVRGASDAAVINLMNELQQRGVKVVTIGQDYLVSVPSSLLFPDQSPRLIWDSYSTLNVVIAFLRQFRKIAVNVTAYSTYYQSVRRTEALSHARAAAVTDYLWSQGIDTRMLISSGEGMKYPIASCGPHGDKSLNSRVEITFRDAVT